MKLYELKEELNAIKYQKSQLLFFTGEKKKFEKLVKSLPECQILSVRKLLLKACKDQRIYNLDREKTAQIIKENLPREKGKNVAIVDNELMLKYDLFTTTIRGQTFHNIPFIIHIPLRYKNFIKNTTLHPVEG